jgi:hypothetical protein
VKWTGACSGKKPCAVRMTKAQSVKATFVKNPPRRVSAYLRDRALR